MTSQNPETTPSSTPSSLPETSSSHETRDTFLLRTAKKIGFGALRETVSRVNEKYEAVMRKGIVTDYPLEITHPSLYAQNEAYDTYEENLDATAARETRNQERREYEERKITLRQNLAFDTYEDNIKATTAREKAEEKQYEADKKKLKILKVKHGLGRAGSMAMWIPGLDIIGESLIESRSSSKRRKQRIKEYKRKNGTLLGNKKQGYSSTLGAKYRANKRRHENERVIIKDVATLIQEREAFQTK